MGVVFATYFATRLKMADAGYFESVLDWTRPYFAEYVAELKRASVEPIVDAMKQDKKNSGDQVTFILSRRPGIMEKVAMDAATVPAWLEDCRNLL
jgi:3-dehydroquinate synthetase